METKIPMAIIDKYFQDNPLGLVKHHLDSYNDFFFGGIERIFKEKNPIRIMKQQDPETNEFRLKANLFLGGREGTSMYYGKPMIYDENNEHFMYPNEARLRNMTYAITIHYDVVVDFYIRPPQGSDDSSFNRPLKPNEVRELLPESSVSIIDLSRTGSTEPST